MDDSSWCRKNCVVMLESYVELTDGGDQGFHGGDSVGGRTKSLTDNDLEELKRCLDIWFGFCYEDIQELCYTLPPLELCYSMSQGLLDEQQQAADEVEAIRARDRERRLLARKSSSLVFFLSRCIIVMFLLRLHQWEITIGLLALPLRINLRLSGAFRQLIPISCFSLLRLPPKLFLSFLQQ